jgi:hypothetical protein
VSGLLGGKKMIYSIYNKNTGKIDKTINCSPELIELQLDAVTHGYIEGYYDDSNYYIKNNIAIVMPAKPSDYHIFDYKNKKWIDPRTSDTEWRLVRQNRDKLLQSSDWTQLPDVPLATKEAWATYRQALRDITNQPDPFNIVWPTPPQ